MEGIVPARGPARQAAVPSAYVDVVPTERRFGGCGVRAGEAPGGRRQRPEPGGLPLFQPRVHPPLDPRGRRGAPL
jgi:hypothetical protein